MAAISTGAMQIDQEHDGDSSIDTGLYSRQM